jgi:hypothetical protein
MERKKSARKPLARTVILPDDFSYRRELMFSDQRWDGIKSHIPTLDAESDAKLRASVTECCNWLITQKNKLKIGASTAAVMRSPGKRQPAPFERLATGLRMAADAWQEIIKAGPIYDDRLTDIRRFDSVQEIAQDAERRLAGYRKLGPKRASPPFPEFVCMVARCCHAVGLDPIRTGRVYDPKNAGPAWFQQFVVALNDQLLGDEDRLSEKALHSAVAQALRGYAKAGKARK